MGDSLRRSAEWNRKAEFMMQYRRTGEGLNSRSHKKLMKELELHGTEETGEHDLCSQSSEGLS